MPKGILYVRVKQNDLHKITMKLVNPNGAAQLAGATVRFHLGLAGVTAKIDAVAVVESAAQGTVSYTFVGADLDTVDNYLAEWEVTYSDATVETFPGAGHIDIEVVDDLA